MSTAADDRRPVAELLRGALDSADEDLRWEFVMALHWRGSREILDHAVRLCRSPEVEERRLAANVLGQLGVSESAFPHERFHALIALLGDGEPDVLSAAIIALHHLDTDEAAPHIVRFGAHPAADIRYAVAFALGGVARGDAIDALVTLTSDSDGDVRNWAVFGVGQQSDADSPQIREALTARLDDPEEEVRYEAIIGLARRGDTGMIGYLKTMLHDDPGDLSARDAATRMLGLEEGTEIGTTELLGALQRLQRWRRRAPRDLP